MRKYETVKQHSRMLLLCMAILNGWKNIYISKIHHHKMVTSRYSVQVCLFHCEQPCIDVTSVHSKYSILLNSFVTYLLAWLRREKTRVGILFHTRLYFSYGNQIVNDLNVFWISTKARSTFFLFDERYSKQKDIVIWFISIQLYVLTNV